MRGEPIIPPGVDKLLATGDGRLASALTARETQVMEMLARGMTNREIAHDLGISAAGGAARNMATNGPELCHRSCRIRKHCARFDGDEAGENV